MKSLKGHIDEIAPTDAAVDVIVSTGVIDLSPDKARVLREAFRVLRPGACGTATLAPSASGRIVSAFVRARKPLEVRA